MKPLSYDTEKKTGICHHCESVFVQWKPLPDIQNFVAPRIYKRPVSQELKIDMSEKVLKYFEGRGISAKTIYEMKVSEQAEWIPVVAANRNCICFNYFRAGELINIKFRDGAKNFKLVKDAELIPYNLDGLQDQTEAIWCEGEFDQLSFFECGIKNAVSVPNGAQKTKQNLTYIDNIIQDIEHIQVHYIATDNDENGRALRDELIRRFGAENCKVIDFKDCKDANEYLLKHGRTELVNTYKNASFVPLSGVFSITENYNDILDLWRNGMPKGKDIQHVQVNKLVTWVSGALAIWTGIPSMGKSEFVDEVCEQLNIMYGWKVAYYSPENWPIKTHVAKIASRISGKMFNTHQLDEYEVSQTINYIKDNFFFITPEDEDVSIENILKHAKSLIKRNGIKILVIDPWNKLDHNQKSGETETQYISKALDELTKFAQRNDILIHLVAHPTKIKKIDGVEPPPTLYDISGSAHFYNKAFYGFCVHRSGDFVELHVLKVKFRHLGEPRGGIVIFRYNINSGRYVEFNEGSFTWDNRSHLVIDLKPETQYAQPNFGFYEKESTELIPF
jgi:twinkle protein